MIIFLKNIPPETHKYEIANFINRVINDCFLGKVYTKISIEDIETFTIQEVDSQALEKHGLVRVFPKEVGKRIIKRLNGTFFKQRCITVREYFNRSADNDLRRMCPITIIDFNEHRTSDRRRMRLMNSWQKGLILVHAVPAV